MTDNAKGLSDIARRDFVKGAGKALGATALAGCGFTLYAMKRALDPLPGVVAGGITRIDTAALMAGQAGLVEYRGRPVFIMKKTASMKPNDGRDVMINNERFIVVSLSCTHLGCITTWNNSRFTCACHGGEFDQSGINTFGPPPSPLEIPPFRIEGSSLVLGETGPEYDMLINIKNKA
jgi:ubiquinol-cytochrome c reductase iron-sulfur subunit